MTDRAHHSFNATDQLAKIAYGRGSWLYDRDGKAYLDGSGGPSVFCLGHAHPEVNDALRRQLDMIAHGYRYHFTSDPLEQLTELIRRLAGAAAADMVFVSGGSEAVESALKIALQYHVDMGQPTRRRFIARRRSWHGNTLGALSVSEFKERREKFEGSLIDVTHVSPANAYRPPEGVAVDGIAAHCAGELEREIQRLGPENVAAFIFEPVVGAAGGVVPAPPDYARRMREVCDRHGILLIADEVMCGVGRCGTWIALEHDGCLADITAIAKGLGGGYVPLGAALYSAKVARVLAAGGGPLTGHTFTGHTLACAAGLAVQSIIARDRLIDRVALDGGHLIARLRDRLKEVPIVGDVRGRGFFVGIEFVADRATRKPLDPNLRFHDVLMAKALEIGLICYPCWGNVDGVSGDTVILSPAYNIPARELDLVVDLTRDAIVLAWNAVLANSGS